MPFPWKSYMDRREQDREIRKFMDGFVVQAAYGGMRYRNDTPPAATIGTTPEKITLYNEEMPIGGAPLNVSFDQANSEIIPAANQGGVYKFTYFISFQGVQNRNYTIAAYIDSGSGPVQAGDPILIRVSSQDPFAEIQLSTMAMINGDWRISMWANADTAGSTFNVYGTSAFLVRIGPQLPDTSGAARISF